MASASRPTKIPLISAVGRWLSRKASEGASWENLRAPDEVVQAPHTSTTYFGEQHAFTIDEYDDGEVRIS